MIKQATTLPVLETSAVLVGMSFDRGWTSCMDATEGSNKQYPKARLKMVVFEPPNPTKGKR